MVVQAGANELADVWDCCFVKRERRFITFRGSVCEIETCGICLCMVLLPEMPSDCSPKFIAAQEIIKESCNRRRCYGFSCRR